jgi:hypothetical protein
VLWLQFNVCVVVDVPEHRPVRLNDECGCRFGVGIGRYSQWGAAAESYGITLPLGHPNVLPILPNVGIANLVDLYDAGSPCGSVHIRNKTMVGERLAAAALALGYNKTTTLWNGPVPKTFALDAGDKLTIQ